jgi:exopolysaccharide production protein ExoZ
VAAVTGVVRRTRAPPSGGFVPSSQHHGRLSTVQIIRAFAALLVVLAHGAKELLKSRAVSASTLWPYILDRGQFGVDLFFVISGFIIAHVSHARMSEPCNRPTS